MVLVLIGFTLIVLIDLVPLIRKHLGHDIIAFLLLFILGLTIAILEVSGVEVPSIMLLLGDVLKSLGMSY